LPIGERTEIAEELQLPGGVCGEEFFQHQAPEQF
jgi:hypothetical protein